MKKLIETIKLHIKENNTVFVFPSEIAAAEWAVYTVSSGITSAVFKDRFISWDTFKESTFQLFRDEQPVNRVIRSLYASHLLEKNKKQNNLSNIIPAEYKEYSHRFRRLVESILMSVNAEEKIAESGLDEGFKEQLGGIYKKYNEFLKKHQLFEPASIHPDIVTGDKKYIITGPEIISDFSDYKILLSENSNIKYYSFKASEDQISLKEFSTSKHEINWIIEIVKKQYIKNPQLMIAVSSPENEAWLACLNRELTLHGIPFTIRGGDSLVRQSGAVVFSHLSALLAANLDSSTLYSVLLDNAVPWKDKNLLHSMIIRLAEKNFVKNSQYEKDDQIYLRLRGCKEGSAWYKKLKEVLKAVRDSKTFSSLYAAVEAFVYGFLDISRFPHQQLQEYQLAMSILQQLSEFADLYAELELPDLYSVFLEQIKNKVYVPRQTQQGVQIFPYRVAAGIPADLHILGGCSQSASLVKQSPFPFLRDDQRTLLQIKEKDFSDDFLTAYTACLCVPSFARDAFSGPQLPPGYFIKGGNVVVMPPKDDLVSVEKKAWAAGVSPGVSVYPRQIEGLQNYVNRDFSRKQMSLSANDPLPKSLAGKVLENMSDQGFLKMSATSLRNYTTCGFSFLFTNLLHLEEPAYDPEFTDYLFIGQLEHTVMEEFYNFVIENGGILGNLEYDLLKNTLSGIIEERLSRVYVNPYFDPAYKADVEKAAEAMFVWLDNELKTFPQSKAVALEEKIEHKDKSIDVLYNGKIDRISSAAGELYVVDYKHNNMDSNLRIKETDPAKTSFQIPFYLFLMHKSNKKAGGAFYYSFGQRKYQQVLGDKKSEVSEDEMEEVITAMEKHTADSARNMRSGLYSAIQGSCMYCSLRGLCRVKFALP